MDQVANGDDLARRVEAGGQALEQPVARPADRAGSIARLLQKMGPEIQKALPKHMTPDRLLRVAVTTIRTNPALLECTDVSLLAAVMQSAQLGLEPGMLGQCYFVPFRNNQRGVTEVTFIIGYKGMIDLARRSGEVSMIYAKPVYAKDKFSYRFGLNPDLEHVPFDGEQPQDADHLTHVYMVARFKDGGFHFGVMNKAQVEAIRAKSKAKDSGPWKTDYVAMALKSVVRQEWKWLPVSIEALKAVTADETAKDQIAPVMLDVVPTDVVDVMPEAEVEAVVAEATEPAEAEQGAAKPKGRGGKAKDAQAAQDDPQTQEPTPLTVACGKCGTTYQLTADTTEADVKDLECSHCGERWLTIQK